MKVTRYQSATDFYQAAGPLLMQAEAENNLIIGIVQGLARSPAAERDAYMAAVCDEHGARACGVHIPPYKLVITRANREPVAALAKDAFQAIGNLAGVTGPSRSAGDFALAFGRLSGRQPRAGMRMRIHETRKVADGIPVPHGRFRQANGADRELLAAWTDAFVTEALIPDPVDAMKVVDDGIARGRLYVWEDEVPVSMAAWAGKTPNGVRINFVYTPREMRRRGYASACVAELTRQQLAGGNAFCWLYTDISHSSGPKLFKRIGYWPVSDVAEYYF